MIRTKRAFPFARAAAETCKKSDRNSITPVWFFIADKKRRCAGRGAGPKQIFGLYIFMIENIMGT